MDIKEGQQHKFSNSRFTSIRGNMCFQTNSASSSSTWSPNLKREGAVQQKPYAKAEPPKAKKDAHTDWKVKSKSQPTRDRDIKCSTQSNIVGALGQVSIVSHSYQTSFSFPGSDLNLDCRLCDHVITRFPSVGIRARLKKVISFCYFRFFFVFL
jgi:hypothetical protein